MIVIRCSWIVLCYLFYSVARYQISLWRSECLKPSASSHFESSSTVIVTKNFKTNSIALKDKRDPQVSCICCSCHFRQIEKKNQKIKIKGSFRWFLFLYRVTGIGLLTNGAAEAEGSLSGAADSHCRIGPIPACTSPLWSCKAGVRWCFRGARLVCHIQHMLVPSKKLFHLNYFTY